MPSRVILPVELVEEPGSWGAPIRCLAPLDSPGSHPQDPWASIVLAEGPCIHNNDFHLLHTLRALQRLWGDKLQEKWGHQTCTMEVSNKQICA